jgi:hypothetical protein
MSLLESDLQAALITWKNTLVRIYPSLEWFHAVPNGGKRDSREAQGLKGQGVTAGILDLALDVARGGFHGFKLELKKPGGKCAKPSKEQEKYIEFVTAEGYFCAVSNDFVECKSLVLDYLEGRLVRVFNA